jgi:hypothetical protein
MDFSFIHETSSRSPSGKVIGIALAGIAALICMVYTR